MTFLGRTALFLVIFVLITGISLIALLYNFHRVGSTDIVYELSLTDNPSTVKLPRSDGVYNGELYIPMKQLAEPLGFAVTGDVNQHSYISRDSKEFIRFSTDSATVVVNNTRTHMNAPARMVSGELYVPLNFIRDYMTGITVTQDENNPSIIKLSKDEADTDVAFLLKDPSPEAFIDELAFFGSIYIPPFTAELDEYEKYMSPSDVDEFLFLVNKKNRMASDSVPDDLTNCPDTIKDGRNTIQLRLYAAKALEAMLKESRALGYPNIALISGYRSYEYQQMLLDNEIQAYASYGDKAEEMATKAVAYPGASEHQSGLAADICSTNVPGEEFGDTEEGKWLENNAHTFGFILRYPKDKTDITEIMYEPWHFRYVGRYHATRMYELGMCLEEYMAYLGLPTETKTE